MRCGGGDGSDGVFVGCGGMSVNEYSEVLSLKKSCVLDGASEDIDVGDGGNDESLWLLSWLLYLLGHAS